MLKQVQIMLDKWHQLRKRIHQRSRKRKFWGNGWSAKEYLHKNHIKEQCLTLYNYSNIELPCMDLLSKTKVIVLLHFG